MDHANHPDFSRSICFTACRGAGQLDQAIFSLTAKVMHHESLAAAATEKSLTAAKAEHEMQVLELQLAAAQLHEELEQVRLVAAVT